MNRTSTPFGARRLRDWVRKPLVRCPQVLSRLEVVEELAYRPPACLENIFARLKKLPDLEAILSSLHFQRINPKRLLVLLTNVHDMVRLLPSPEQVEAEVTSSLLKEELSLAPHDFVKTLQHWLNHMDPEEAKAENKHALFTDTAFFPDLGKKREKVATVELALQVMG